MLNIIVNGAQGKMGRVTVDAINAQADLNLVAALGKDDDLANAIETHQANVVVDFTTPSSVFANSQTIIKANAHPVIGTTGLTMEQITQLQQQCADKNLGGLIAPNFSIGAILMMRYASDAAKYLPDVEIIEMHHPHKLDAPSGTSIKTAQMIQESRADSNQEVPIHSVRLSGLFAHQVVLLGSDGETLTIRHDGMDRGCMMPGVVLACHKVPTLNSLVYGLETLI